MRLACAGLLLAVMFHPRTAMAEDVPSPITASSYPDDAFLPEFAVDGNAKTRWASREGEAEAWLQVDFGRRVKIRELSIHWEAAYAADYEIALSNDGARWKSIYHQKEGKGGEERLAKLKGRGRFLRVLCHKPGPYPLYSIWDLTFADAQAQQALSKTRERITAIRAEALRGAREQLRNRLRAAGADEIVFATRPMYPDGHWYANISYYCQDAKLKTYAKGGGLYKLKTATGETVPLIEDAEGTVRDPAVHYDGETIIFSWRKGGTESFHLYTIRPDGGGLKQLTFGDYDDIEPAWLPDGGIAFVSSRCRRWVNCWLTQVAVLHRCDADGQNIVPLSSNLEQDNTPWPMPDGRILYTRWEYVDRSQVDYHHLWTMNPDGTAQMVYFGNLHPGGVFIDAKAVPGTDEVLFINSPGHGQREHVGSVALLDVKEGPDHLPSIRNISKDGYRDPYPVTPDTFVAAQGKNVVVMGADGVTDRLFTLPASAGACELHEPRPIVLHKREAVIPSRVDYKKETGKMVLIDVRAGRNMNGVAPGEIKKLLVLESLPKPINYTGGMDPLTYGGSFTLERVLGTVPVEADGSAYLELPASRALFFVALDANNDSVKRMQSFCSVMPGETVSCLGCHDARVNAEPNRSRPTVEAMKHGPRAIEPIRNIPAIFDFPRDIQPILDKHCVPCHDYGTHPGAAAGPRAGGIILSGDHGPMFSHSYVALTVFHQFVDGRDQPKSNLPPRSIGASASPIMDKLHGEHHGAKLSAKEIDYIRYWIESGAAYPGTYAALGGGSIGGYYANEVIENDTEWPASKAAAEAIATRCAACHANEKSLPKTLSDENTLSFWRPEWTDQQLQRSRHLMFNLSRPELSLMALAPLAKEAGGYGLCRVKNDAGEEKAVFPDRADPDYQKIVAMCAAGKERLEAIKRFDMPGFRPPEPYLREMKRYQVLPADFGADSLLDPYKTDLAYWSSFEARVALKHPAYGGSEPH
jgi:hypothetical protein